MTILALDTCGHACSLALVAAGGEPLAIKTKWMARGHGAALPALAAQIFAAHDPALVRGLVVTRGPGGFTGMRAGLAYARAFSLARDIPAYGMDVFTALRLTVPDQPILAIDSRRGDFFIDGPSADALGLPGQWLASANDLAQAHPAGSWGISQEETPKIGWHEPCPQAMARQGLTMMQQGVKPLPGDLDPLYVRAPSVG